MSLLQEIENYIPGNQQEESDKEQMLWFIKNHSDYLDRTNQLASNLITEYGREARIKEIGFIDKTQE